MYDLLYREESDSYKIDYIWPGDRLDENCGNPPPRNRERRGNSGSASMRDTALRNRMGSDSRAIS